MNLSFSAQVDETLSLHGESSSYFGSDKDLLIKR